MRRYEKTENSGNGWSIKRYFLGSFRAFQKTMYHIGTYRYYCTGLPSKSASVTESARACDLATPKKIDEQWECRMDAMRDKKVGTCRGGGKETTPVSTAFIQKQK